MSLNGPIVIVAPYSPIGSCETPSLPSARKIESIVRILARYGRRIVFINSAHNETIGRFSHLMARVIGGVRVVYITPFTLPSRPLGKVLNLFVAGALARRLAREGPALVWTYNAYAFEAKIALWLKRLCGCPWALELEDWPTARKRPFFNLKPRLDLLYLRRSIVDIDLVTCVNQSLREQLGSARARTVLLPYVVDPQLVNAPARRPFTSMPFTLGYFGTLTEEKGTDIVLQIVDSLPDEWRLCVTGSGPMRGQFEDVARIQAKKVHFTAEAPDDLLRTHMLHCDVVLNPHKDIAQMGNGVFPFKVLEGVVSGRLLLSTPLPDCGLPLKESVLSFDGTPEDLINKLQAAPHFYRGAEWAIGAAREAVAAEYSEEAIFERLRHLIRP